MTEGRAALEDALAHPMLPPDDRAHDGPPVTIVTPTHDGVVHLRRLVAVLDDRTDYRAVELVVVDNASGPETASWLDDRAAERDGSGPGVGIRVVRNDRNESFSRACNQGIAMAGGDYCLLLNDDVEPMHADWLTRLVAAMEQDATVSAAGALLVYPPRPAGTDHPHPDLSVQHAGVAFLLASGSVGATNIGTGSDPRRPSLRRTAPVAGLTAACLLARTALLRELGGLDEVYDYGSEDWDLSMRLAQRGRLVLVGRAVAYHHEYGTQSRQDDQVVANRRRGNRTAFNRRWGPALRRQVLAERLGGQGDRGRPDDPDGVAVATTTPPEVAFDLAAAPALAPLADEFRRLGWSVVDDAGGSTDLEVVLQGALPERPGQGLLVVAVTRPAQPGLPGRVDLALRASGTRPNLGAHPTVVADHPAGHRPDAGPDLPRADRVLSAARALVARPRIAVRICPPDVERAPRWGDTHFARSFAAALGRRGLATGVQIVPDWDRPWAHTFDVVVHLRGLRRYHPQPGAHNVLWIVSHPEAVTDDELDDFDLVLVASHRFADVLRGRTNTPVEVLLQATDTTMFRPRQHPSRAEQRIVVVANSRWPSRRGPRWLMELGWDFGLYGANWSVYREGRRVAGDFVPNGELADVYQGADVVVADQWDLMAREGFVANRVFDVLASGGFVLSDDGPGITDVFGDALPTWGTRAELDAQLRHHLADPIARDRVVAELLPLVHARHSFDARVVEFLDLVGIGAD